MVTKKSKKREIPARAGAVSPNIFSKILRKIQLDFFITHPKNTLKNSILWVSLVFLGLLVFLLFKKGIFVAALVGKKPIFRLSLVKALEKSGGKQTLENLITKELIIQEAQKKKVNISDQDVENEIKVLGERISAQGLSLEEALAMQNQTKEDLRENIKIQLMVEELLKDRIQFSEEEVQDYFENNKNLYPPETKIEDVKEDLINSLRQQKLASEFQNWIKDLRDKTQVKYFVNF